MELPGDILRIISSFLMDRTIQVRIGNTLSEVVKLLAGTPQGSILSPLLFILFVNDIPVTQACQVTQYTDDIAIYTSHRNPRYLEAHLQKQVDELEDWCEDWFIKLNAKKTQLMIITRQNSRKMIPITVRNNQVEILDLAILLGTTLDRTMNLKPHQPHKQDSTKNRKTETATALGSTPSGTEDLLHKHDQTNFRNWIPPHTQPQTEPRGPTEGSKQMPPNDHLD